MQTREWAEFKSHFGWEYLKQYTDFSILKKSKFGISILYIPRGPLCTPKELPLVLEKIKEIAKKEKAFFVRVSPPLLEPAPAVLNQHGFFYSKKQLQTKATVLVNLNRTEEELLASFHEKTRYNIRLAGKKGVTVTTVTSEDQLKQLYGVLEQMAARQSYNLQAYEYYKYIWQNLSSISSIYIALHDNKVIGGVVVFYSPQTAYYMYGGFDYEYRNLMGNYLVHWEIMRQAKAKGITHYDLQGIPLIKDENHPMYGFYRFKKGFNGQEIEFVGEYDYAPNRLLYKLWEMFPEKNLYLE
jgi:lipid II:glycine glycyltransferase (peptidoglycan interpeptide bridge formation enzyme)